MKGLKVKNKPMHPIANHVAMLLLTQEQKTLSDYFTQGNITTVIAVAGFVMSLGQLLWGAWNKRYNLKISNTGYSVVESKMDDSYREYIFGFFIENLSTNPVNIMYISALCENGSYVRCTLTHRFLKEHFIPPGITRTYQFFTSDFPIHLDGRCSELVFVIFTCPENEKISFSDQGIVTFYLNSDRKDEYISIVCNEKTNFMNQ